MPYIHTGLLSLVISTLMISHMIGSYIFFRKYMEVIESSLNDIYIFSQNRDYYGNTLLGRKMRKIFIMLVIVMPRIFKKQEAIPAYKFEKLSPRLMLGVKFIFHTNWLIAVALGLLYYFRLRYR